MFRFLRRVFIILILLIIVFFVFRLIKPEATSRFVDKVKTIPTTISSRFHREKKTGIIINGDTTSTSSNFEINTNDNDDTNYEYYDGEYVPAVVNEDEINNNDNGELNQAWLEELNRELDKILASGNAQSQGEGNSGNAEELLSGLINDNVEIVELTGNNQDTGFVVIDVEQPYEPEVNNSTNTQANTTTNTQTTNTQTSTTTTTNTQTTTNNSQSNYKTQQRGDCGEGLTVQDCEDLLRDLGNINFN